MIEVLERTKCKLMDKVAGEKINIPSIILMENAAIQVVNKIENEAQSFLIICGKGNNGGDGLAIARHLHLKGKEIRVYILSKDMNFTDDFKTNLDILENLTDEIFIINKDEDIDERFIDDLQTYDMTLDGIFGVGLNREVEGIFKRAIGLINRYSKYICSIDIPSGLDSDSGNIRAEAVKADVTYSFEVIKRGFLNYKSIEHTGRVEVLKIGIPEKVKKEISDKIYILNEKEYKNMLPKRSIYGHKGSYGRAFIIAGSSGLSGAAFIATECTVRTGAGLTTLICPSDIQGVLSSKLVEAMTLRLESENICNYIAKADSIAFGPGIGVTQENEELLAKVIQESKCPIVIDADGIKLLAKNKQLINKIKGRCVITPHPGEMAAFLGTTIEEIERDRVNITISTAKKYGIVVLLKGYNTVISNGDDTYVNLTGNSKMASGGMGDALTGIINGLLSQGMNVKDASILGAYVHGRIADRLSQDSYVVNARDIISNLPLELNNIDNS